MSSRNRTDVYALQQSERFDSLEKSVQLLVSTLLSSSTTSQSKELHDQAMGLAKLLDRTELVVRDMGDQSRYIVVDVVQRAISEQFQKCNASRTIAQMEGDIFEARPDQRQHGMDLDHAILKARENETKAQKLVEESIIASLRFSNMKDRQEAIADAHTKTFDWIFNPTDEGSRWSNFTEWLQSGKDIYWINGKAGSGKSTLMRYVAQHATTKRLLAEWAHPLQCITASFYFWNSGTSMQRSQMGLLRAILCEIFSQHRQLIHVLLPTMWARGYSELPWNGKHDYVKLTHPHDDRWSVDIQDLIMTWNTQKLMRTFKLLLHQQAVPLKLCLFVDGLDEYEGDHSELADIFQSVGSTSCNIKVFLSSRPLLVFEDSFKSNQSLRLQDLTLGDVRSYVIDKFNGNRGYRRLASQEPDLAPYLVEEVVTKADGVFLWVRLVVHSLLQGLNNRDTLADLQRRLRLLPPDLEDLYQLMMKNIDSFYRGKASETFQLLSATQLVADNIGNTKSPEYAILSVQALWLADTEHGNLATRARVEYIPNKEIYLRCEKVIDQLKVRTAGLVEVRINKSTGLFTPEFKIQYLHRTVRDYFQREEVRKTILGWTAEKDYNPHVALMKSYLLHLRVFANMTRHRIAALVMAHAYYAERTTGNPRMEILHRLDQTMDKFFPGTPDAGTYWTCNGLESKRLPKDVHSPSSFLAVASLYGLAKFVDNTITYEPKLLRNDRWTPLLFWAVISVVGNQSFPGDPELVKLLLVKHGAKPNKKHRFSDSSEWTPWEIALIDTDSCLNVHAESPTTLTRKLQTLRILLEAGADPDVAVNGRNYERTTIYTLLKNYFYYEIPEQARELEMYLKGLENERNTRGEASSGISNLWGWWFRSTG